MNISTHSGWKYFTHQTEKQRKFKEMKIVAKKKATTKDNIKNPHGIVYIDPVQNWSSDEAIYIKLNEIQHMHKHIF